jgi:hypothetical protein
MNINLTKPAHRVLVLRAYHELLSEGKDEKEAKAGAVRRAIENRSKAPHKGG